MSRCFIVYWLVLEGGYYFIPDGLNLIRKRIFNLEDGLLSLSLDIYRCICGLFCRDFMKEGSEYSSNETRL